MAKESRSRKQKKKRSALFSLFMVLMLFAVLFWAVGAPLLKKWLPSRERKDLNEWFEVSGDEVRIYLDFEMEKTYTALAYGGEVYLPYDYVYGSINARFYLNNDENLLSYTLPLETYDYGAGDLSENGAPCLITEGGETYVLLPLIEQYTNITHEAFIDDDDDAKRVFITKGGTKLTESSLTKKAFLRTAADKKAPVLAELKKGETLLITESGRSFSRVWSDRGLIGYINTAALDESGETSYIFEDTYDEPAVPYVRLNEKLVLGFQAAYTADMASDFEGCYENTAGAVNAATPQWLQISDEEGTLVDLTSAKYIAAAHEAGVKVWPSVDNINQEGGVSGFDTGEFFSDTKKRRDFISTLIEKAVSYGYDGLNLDFEGLKAESGYSFTQFFRELSAECHKKGLTLSIDNYVPYSYNSFYNLPEQGVFADYVVIMCYDEHTGSDIGPVASLPYTEYGISEALKYVPAEGLAAALPFYTRVWRTNEGVVTSEAMGMKEASQYVSNNAIALLWDDEAGCYYGETMIGAGEIELWVEDKTSLGLKADLAREYDIAGIALWRLGLEPAGVWEVLDLNAG